MSLYTEERKEKFKNRRIKRRAKWKELSEERAERERNAPVDYVEFWGFDEWFLIFQSMFDAFAIFVLKFFVLVVIAVIAFIIFSIYQAPIKNYEYEADFDIIYEQEYGTSNSWHNFKFSIDEPTWIKPVTDTRGIIATKPDGYIVRSDSPEEIIYYNAYPAASGVQQEVYLTEGDYTFVVGANCMYDFSLRGFDAGLKTLNIKSDKENENNDSFKKANRYNIESGKTGSLKTKEDADYYKIEIKESMHCYFNFSSNPVIGTFTGKRGYFNPDKKRTLSDAEFFKIDVFKDNEELMCDWVSYGNDEYQISFEPGIYYIRVSAAQEYYDGEYSFVVSENEFD